MKLKRIWVGFGKAELVAVEERIFSFLVSFHWHNLLVVLDLPFWLHFVSFWFQRSSSFVGSPVLSSGFYLSLAGTKVDLRTASASSLKLWTIITWFSCTFRRSSLLPFCWLVFMLTSIELYSSRYITDLWSVFDFVYFSYVTRLLSVVKLTCFFLRCDKWLWCPLVRLLQQRIPVECWNF